MTKWIFTFLAGMMLLACNPAPDANGDNPDATEQDDEIYLTATGFEPGWTLEVREAVNDEYHFKLQVNNGTERTNGLLKRMQNTDTKQVFMGMDAGNRTVQVVFDKQECIHPSGEAGDGAVSVTWKKENWMGCGDID